MFPQVQYRSSQQTNENRQRKVILADFSQIKHNLVCILERMVAEFTQRLPIDRCHYSLDLKGGFSFFLAGANRILRH
jgi:hypothetical protein